MSDTPHSPPLDVTRNDQLHILLVNMNRSNFKLTSLLQSTTADCLLVQEPWWGALIPQCSDTDPDGCPAFGTIAHPAWSAFTPPSSSSPDGHPWVITFLRKRLLASFTVTPSPDLSSYNLLGLTLASPSFHLTIINFYHHVRGHQGNLTNLTDFSPSIHTPILLAGDFNTHSDTWSPGGKRASPWAPSLEGWLDEHGFVSTVPDGSISRRLTTSLPSLIDFIFVNEKFLEVPSFPASCSVSFDSSIGSDHAGLSISIPVYTTPPHLLRPPGWKIDPDLRDTWCARFRDIKKTPITDEPSLLHAAQHLLTHIIEVSDSLFPRRSLPSDRDLPWWTWECSLACAALKTCHWRDRKQLSSALCMTIRNAKREWVDSLADNPDVSIWDMAKWRKGRRLKDIPPIMTSTGPSQDPALMTETFLSRFFFLDTHQSEPLSPLTCRSLLPRPLHDVHKDEVRSAFRTTSTSSAPGPSGIGYLLLRWAFDTDPELFTHIFTHALRLGKHPWNDALVVVIPKPGKSDYTVAKAYRPISLLECCGKLLEK
jgi:endonuclease/exonuclease/phosphatase (EEP) superfamily protein YafD